jgi:hypothetical protein
MQVKNLYFSTAWRGIYVVLCSTALAMELGIGGSRMNWYVLNYYTVLSNIACVVFFTLAFAGGAGALAVEAGRAKKFSFAPRFEAAILYCIALTGIIYAALLAPADAGSPRFFSFENMMLHFAGPAAVFVDWLLFAPKGRLRAKDPLRWLLIPLAYFIYILVRSTFAGDIGETGSRFPYGFLDPAVQGGWGRMFAGVGLIALGMATTGYLIWLLDLILGRVDKYLQRRA